VRVTQTSQRGAGSKSWDGGTRAHASEFAQRGAAIDALALNPIATDLLLSRRPSEHTGPPVDGDSVAARVHMDEHHRGWCTA
jgi:hypothetical protein